MYAIEFEADIQNGTVKIPEQYSHLQNSHARIVIMVKDQSSQELTENNLDLSNSEIAAFEGKDGLEIQGEMRDEW